MDYAIIETGGKQFIAEAGKQINIEKLAANEGDKVKFDKVLLVSNKGKISVGQPYVKGAAVEAKIVKNFKDRKVIAFKYIRRENGTKTKTGHRQQKTRVEITSVPA